MTSIERSTGFLVVRTARSMKKALDTRLTEIGVTAVQYTVLNTLAQTDGLSLSEIGKRVFLDKPAITGLADRLENDGLVERQRNSKDRRVIKLYLSPKGRRLLGRMNDIVNSVDEELTSVLSSSELGTFREMLDRIWNNANGRTTHDN
ncbi:MAG: MarR family transcriptional regulator [Chlorobi bacterium]|nr:MarR family transcriptional regulator [Chlorobiota bacterium]